MIIKLIRCFKEHWTFKKRKSQIMQTATDFWNECEQSIREKEKYEQTA